MTEIEKLTYLLATEVVAQTFSFSVWLVRESESIVLGAGEVVQEGMWEVSGLSINGSCSGIRLVQPSVLLYPGPYLKFLNEGIFFKKLLLNT